MHLISPLSTGVAGAGNGTARVYSRGTSTPAALYSDYIGTALANTTAGQPLDANGSALIYVNESVDVSVSDSTGLGIRNWTEMIAPSDVEVRSQSFIGRDYTTNASAAGNPTDLQTILDLIKTSFGSTNWNVLLPGGSTSTLQAAIAGLAGIFFNVKSPTYGAVGDGATDDTTAIQAAITAANAAGGGIVYFPAGTYRTTSTVTVAVNVSLWGAQPLASAIKLDEATGLIDVLTYSTSMPWYQEVRNLSFMSAQARAGAAIRISSATAARVSVTNCFFDPTNTGNFSATAVRLTGSTGNSILMDSCEFTLGSANSYAILADVAGNIVDLRNCTFVPSVATYNGGVASSAIVVMRNGSVSDCFFNCFVPSAGTFSAILCFGSAGAGPRVCFTGNRFTGGGGATFSAFDTSGANEATTSIAEAGSMFASVTTPFKNVAVTVNLPTMAFASREYLQFTQTGTGAADIALKGDQFGISIVERTGDVAANLTSPVGPLGSRLTVIILAKGVALTAPNQLVWGTGFKTATMTSPGALNINTSAIFEFRAVYENGAAYWAPMATSIKNI